MFPLLACGRSPYSGGPRALKRRPRLQPRHIGGDVWLVGNVRTQTGGHNAGVAGHDVRAAEGAREEFNRVFSKREIPEDIETREISIAAGPLRLTKVLALVNLAPSNAEAQRLIESGAVHMNGQRITDPKAEISTPGEYLFKVGKRRFLKLLVR